MSAINPFVSARTIALGLTLGLTLVAALLAQSAKTPGTPLVGTRWRATELGGKPVAPQSEAREAHLVFESTGRVGGSDGCNRVTGGYELTGERVKFGQTAATQMACLNPTDTERPFRDALTGATRLSIVGDRLELYNGTGSRLAVFTASAQSAGTSTRDPLAGTSWQLVRFQGGDGAVLTPDDRTKYTIELDGNGGVAARIDCNRGRGTWTSSGASQLQFGPLALTRALCPPGSMHDQIVKQWGNIRSYTMKNGHLFLSLMADGGIYEFEPARSSSASFTSPVRPRGPATWTCARDGAAPEMLRVTVYATQPALALLERGGVTRPAFQVKAASGTRYEGDSVLFWEARGEATLNWMGAQSTCKPN
jgi:heat shock protein HslJ